MTETLERLATRTTANVLVAVGLALIVLAVVLNEVGHQEFRSTLLGALPVVLSFLAVGAVVARRQPRHPIGWLLLSIGLLFLVNVDASSYAVLDYRHHRGLPAGWLAVLLQPAWAPAIVLIGVIILVFPDGRLPSPRLRWFLWLLLAEGSAWMVGAFAISVVTVADGTIAVSSGGDLVQIDHPTGADRIWWQIQDVFFPLLGLCLAAWLVTQLVLYRRAGTERRQQLKWLVGGAVVAAACGFVSIALSGAAQNFAIGGLAALPVAVGIGILKYRLYEIDRLISRTLSYAIVTGLLVGVFFGVVVLATDVLPFSSPVGVAASTLAAAALFNPLRGRVQRLVDRRFNRARYDVETTVAAFALRLRDAVDLDAVQSGLLEAVGHAVEPAHATIWVRPQA